MLNAGAHIIYDESGATSDSNILNLAKDNNTPLILGNNILTKHIVNSVNNPNNSIGDLFLHSLLERMELLYSKGVLK